MINSTYREHTEWNEHHRVKDGFGNGTRFLLIGQWSARDVLNDRQSQFGQHEEYGDAQRNPEWEKNDLNIRQWRNTVLPEASSSYCVSPHRETVQTKRKEQEDESVDRHEGLHLQEETSTNPLESSSKMHSYEKVSLHSQRPKARCKDKHRAEQQRNKARSPKDLEVILQFVTSQ